MGRQWIHHHHAPFTIFVCFEFRELAKFCGDVRVHWLRPQHMEWFPHPYQTYTRCLRVFICCTGSDGSTTMPLQPYLFVLVRSRCWRKVHKMIHIIRCDPCISVGGMDWYMASILVPRKTEDGRWRGVEGTYQTHCRAHAVNWRPLCG